MNARLAANACRRASIGNLIESMDRCDATRSHELRPFDRLRSRFASRRALRQIGACLAGLVALALLLGAR